MRIIYFLSKLAMQYSLRVFYPRMKLINAPKELFGRTIYVSNHSASFMDPLVVGSLYMPIIFFMTRSDIFKPVMKPIFWACHMFPIYREQDGDDTKGKNEVVFKKCARILKGGRNLLIFGEGFTDDVFIRRLKPVKKGAVRIGFMALEATNWEKKIYMAAVGVNYSDPNQMRSDVLVSTSEKFCLNDYKDEYLANPNKVILQLTKRIEKLMQEQITHIENKDLAPFHEQIMILNRKGMNPKNFDHKISLKERWENSRKMAKWLNEQEIIPEHPLHALKTDMDAYFAKLKKHRIEEHVLHWKMNSNGSRLKEVLMMIVLAPFMIAGLIHCGIPYLLTKNFVEKNFKRKVFWGSVKLIIGQLSIAIFNIPTIFIFYYYVYPSWWLSIAYFLSIGITGLAAYVWFRYMQDYRIKGKLNKMDVSELTVERSKIVERINREVGI